jgi:CheY-like chemotaxis protein
MKVLVVDDNKDTTDLIKVMLESAEYSCTIANDGQRCLDIINDNKFDLILLDLAMPEISGLDVLKKLKEDGKLSDNKVVLFTASPSFSDTEIDKMKKEYGNLERLRKPFNKKELLEIVAKNIR